MTLKATLFLVAAVSVPAMSAFAATPVGDWKAPQHNGVIRILDCADGALCGKVIDGDGIRANPNFTDERNQDPAKRARAMKGLPLFYGVKGGPTEWSGGSLYNPEDGRTYKGSIRLVDADTLKLTGCIVFPLCKSQTWTRIK